MQYLNFAMQLFTYQFQHYNLNFQLQKVTIREPSCRNCGSEQEITQQQYGRKFIRQILADLKGNRKLSQKVFKILKVFILNKNIKLSKIVLQNQPQAMINQNQSNNPPQGNSTQTSNNHQQIPPQQQHQHPPINPINPPINPNNQPVSVNTQLVSYQNLKQVIKNSGFKRINGTSDADYQIIKSQYAAEEIEEICEKLKKKFPTTKQIMNQLKNDFEDRPNCNKQIGVLLNNRAMKAVRIVWEKREKMCLIGTEMYDFNFELNPNTAFFTQNHLYKSEQQYVHTSHGIQIPHTAQQNYASSQEKAVDIARQFDEDDLLALKQMCKIGDGQYQKFKKMLEQYKN